MDAFLAHTWLLIIRARNLPVSEQEPFYWYPSLSLRTRVSPPLPASFIGSPVIMATCRLPTPLSPDVSSPSALSTDLPAAASSIHTTLQYFSDPAKISALLHVAAHCSSPQRY